jgi:nucleoside-diphosphate-sugar epimerase
MLKLVVAGATGAIGRPLCAQLADRGHQVTPLARSLGVDALDRDALLRAVEAAQPDAIVNVLTAVPRALDAKRIAQQFEPTNRLRTEATRTLAEAGVPLISESVAFAYAAGDGLATEDDPLWPDPPPSFVAIQAALVELERVTLETGGAVLRMGHLYGPGTGFAPDGPLAQRVAEGKVPLIGRGRAVFSFLHTADAAAAVVAAAERRAGGVYNVVDDAPTPAAQWLPWLASRVGGPRPRRVPAWVGRLAAGDWGVTYFDRLRGASNAKARAQLGWAPAHPSLEAGFGA